MRRTFAFLLAVAATGIVLSPTMSYAQDRSASVTYSDLDLSTDESMAELNQRIDDAARHVCGFDDPTLGSRLPSREARNCFNETRESIEESLAEVTG